MTSLSRRFADHLCKRRIAMESFHLAYLRLVRHLLMDKIEVSADEEEPSWPAILTWASIFGQSDADEHIELALAGAVSALLTASPDSERARDAAAIVLESASNIPTVRLAFERGIVPKLSNTPDRDRLPAVVWRHQRGLRHFIYDDLHGAAIPVTSFQERTWNALEKEQDTALSAPTSAGKSFILLHWLVRSLYEVQNSVVYAYVVPSRALISQVSRDIAEACIKNDLRPQIATMPTLFTNDPERSAVLVMTQERLERLFAANGSLQLKALVVDEAHKLGEGPRGVVLQRLIDETLRRSSQCRVVLAAPHVNNASVLLPRLQRSESDDHLETVIADARPTVLQNLLWVTRVPHRSARWRVELIQEDKPWSVGEIRIAGKPTGKKKQLAALAFSLGHGDVGNIVFANGAAEAEDIAQLLCQHFALDQASPTPDPEITDLVRLIRDYVHPSYPLVETLPYRVGIHYGDMPEIARREQERLFDEGKLAFLVCTSTLLEGVNLPCRNLFIWGPRQGRSNPMSLHAFWNLAGRAGRWGREFAGNIFCFDVHNESQWPGGAPTRRVSQTVSNAGSQLLRQIKDFRAFADSADPLRDSKENRYFEEILGELVASVLAGGGVRTVSWIRGVSEDQIRALEDTVQSVIDRVSAPASLVQRHSGINPLLISGFLKYLSTLDPRSAETLMPMSPDMHMAQSVLSSNLELCDRFLGSDFGNQVQRNLKSMVTVAWIRGQPLGRIIRQRLDWLRDNRQRVRVPTEIRNLISLINVNARYLVPKYLACYSACVSWWYHRIGMVDLEQEISDLQDMFEAGVAERTMLALVGLGLSRTAAVAVASKIADSGMSVQKVVQWLRMRNLEAYDLSAVIIREVHRALETTDFL
ncbi:MAG: DEAD/DEAH box helicase [Desulfobacterales bacterium]|nr:DEAD/DEAH box helicase [Desulfobacterales bacterium]